MQAAEEAEAAADLLQKAEAALAEVASAEAAAAETGTSIFVKHPIILQCIPLLSLMN